MTVLFMGMALVQMLMASCDSKDARFSLEGRFRGMNQAQLVIFDPCGVLKDTILVRDGRLEYQKEMADTALLMLLFPNYSQMPVFAAPGVSLKIKGNASHLRETTIRGDKVNDEMTEYRLMVADMTPPDQAKTARNYVEDHPESPIAYYLVNRYFVQTAEPDYASAVVLLDKILEKQPLNISAAELKELLGAVAQRKEKGQLPAFKAVSTSGDTVTRKSLDGDCNVIQVWTSWNYDGQNLLRMLRRKELTHGKRLKVVSICLDAGAKEGALTLKRDSIRWPNVCDGEMFRSPLLTLLGLTTADDNIVIDSKGNIAGRSMKHDELSKKIDEMLIAKD